MKFYTLSTTPNIKAITFKKKKEKYYGANCKTRKFS